MDINEEVTPEKIVSLVQLVVELRGRVIAKEKALGAELTKVCEASQKLREGLKSVKDLQLKLQIELDNVQQQRQQTCRGADHIAADCSKRGGGITAIANKTDIAPMLHDQVVLPEKYKTCQICHAHDHHIMRCPFRDEFGAPVCTICGELGHVMDACTKPVARNSAAISQRGVQRQKIKPLMQYWGEVPDFEDVYPPYPNQ